MLYYLCFSPSTAIGPPLAIGSAIGRPLSRPASRPNTVVGVLNSGSEKGVFWKRGLFQKSPFSRDCREFRDSRESPDCGKQRRIRPFSRDSREFRDFRDSRGSSSEKTPFVMTPFSGLDQPPRSKPLGGLNRAIVVQLCLKPI